MGQRHALYLRSLTASCPAVELGSAPDHSHHLDMWREHELIDRRDRLDPEATVDEKPQVAAQRRWIAGHSHNRLNITARQRFRLRLCPGTRRIEYHGVETLELR